MTDEKMIDEKPLSTTKRIDELNALEEGEAEVVAGVSITALETDEPKAKLIAALAWVHRKRTEPKLKFTEYASTHNTKDNAAYLFSTEAEDAEDAAAAAAAAGDDAAEVEDDDPFPEGGREVGTAEGSGEVAAAEGPVLSRDGDQS